MTTDEATAPRRLRAQDVIDAQQRTIEQLTTRSGEPYVTVEHTLNAKGDDQPNTKIHAPLGCDLEALAAHPLKVEQITADTHKLAMARWPRTNGETKRTSR